MLFREIIAVYCENHTEHTNTLCGLNGQFFDVEVGCTYSKHFALMILITAVLCSVGIPYHCTAPGFPKLYDIPLLFGEIHVFVIYIFVIRSREGTGRAITQTRPPLAGGMIAYGQCHCVGDSNCTLLHAHRNNIVLLDPYQ
jgi:hypothetical protein